MDLVVPPWWDPDEGAHALHQNRLGRFDILAWMAWLLPTPLPGLPAPLGRWGMAQSVAGAPISLSECTHILGCAKVSGHDETMPKFTGRGLVFAQGWAERARCRQLQITVQIVSSLHRVIMLSL